MSIEAKLSISCDGLSQSLRLGEKIGARLKGGEVIELIGDVGSGKTSLVKGIAKGAGSHEQVSSPSFTISRIYRALNVTIYHYDFYRIDDAGIMANEIAETISLPDGVVLVEWAEPVIGVLPDKRIRIRITPTAEEQRQFEIVATGFSYILKGLN